MSGTLPNHPSEITLGWLVAVLVAPSLTGFDWEIIGEDFGFTGVVARVRLRYASNHQTGPSSVVAKFPTATRAVASGYRSQQADRQHFERSALEARFYQELADPSPAPACYFQAVDADAGTVVLLIEDLKDARPGDVLAGCSIAEARLVLDAIAPFHARWWNVQPPKWIPGWGDRLQARQERLAGQVGPFLERYGAMLPGDVARLIERLPTQSAGAMADLGAAPATVIHADLHLDNILFEAERAIILDWQSVSHRAAAVDLIYFLLSSLSPEDRRRAEDDLLADYHRQLVEGGVKGYSLHQLRDDCRRALIWALGGTIGWLANADPEAVSSRERTLIQAAFGDGRLNSMLLDWDVTTLLDQ